ncbi:hypothetical protein B9Z19DRAFT_966684, partial [Tuber borchii]
PLILNNGALEHALLIPTTLHFYPTDLPQWFAPQLPPPAAEFALREEPSSVP